MSSNFVISHNIDGVLTNIAGGMRDKLLFVWVKYMISLYLLKMVRLSLVIIFQGQDECKDSGFGCLHKEAKPLFLKELKDLWENTLLRIPC